MKKNKNLLLNYIVSASCFVLGVSAAAFLVYSFCSRPMNTVPNLKDTMLVKLIDPPYIGAQGAFARHDSANALKDTASSGIIKTGQPATLARNDEASLGIGRQTGKKLRRNNPDTIETTTWQKSAAVLSQMYAEQNTFSKQVLFGVLIAALIFATTFFSLKEELSDPQIIDQDPQDLQLLFTEFKDKIAAFRNPRKILRLMNLVKYHYYFLSKNNLATTGNMRKMMWILLGIQSDPSIVSTEGIDSAALTDAKWFYQKIKSKPWMTESKVRETDNDLMMVILKLNIDMGAS